ncbi:MAG: hemin uptake protein HemP [Hyphomicrobiaceae bacterium]
MNESAAGEHPPRRIDIGDLLAGAREVVLVHDGKRYILRVTSRGRLILTR